jgi:hypothetical protein
VHGLALEVRSASATLKALQQSLAGDEIAASKVPETELEAQERLRYDLEAGARAEQARAEEECSRLQGLLAAVETSLRALRSQNSDERDRLKQEQGRLDLLQATLKAEAEGMRARLQKQGEMLMAEASVEKTRLRQVAEDLERQQEEVDAQRRHQAQVRMRLLASSHASTCVFRLDMLCSLS